LWEYTPPSYQALAGTRQITNSTPVADPDRQSIYATSPDGYIQKLAVSDGQPVWRTSITKLPQRETITSPLKLFQGRVIAVTAGYIGDRSPYQGHVALLDGNSGKLLQVWNSLCSNRSGLLEPDSCPQTKSAIWGRAGAVIDPSNGDIFIATGNGEWNGTTDCGDSLIEIDASATKMLGNYTPADTEELNARDLDLGSNSPVLLGWMFAADNGGTAAWELENDKLQEEWKNATGGTSPFEAGGLLFVYAREGGLNVYEAASGKHIATLPCGPGHWNSPIVLQGEIILPEGNANDHATSGVLNIWSLPSGN
jgi:outer membrane protein assembly factor BamB